jgi:hypothetical protein
MKEELNEFFKQEQYIKGKLKEWVKDKSISLEERWEVFIKSGLGIHDNYYQTFGILDGDWIQSEGPIYAERYEKVNVERIIESIEEAKQTLMEDPDDEYLNKDFANVDLVKLKEAILESFIKSFNFDW